MTKKEKIKFFKSLKRGDLFLEINNTCGVITIDEFISLKLMTDKKNNNLNKKFQISLNVKKVIECGNGISCKRKKNIKSKKDKMDFCLKTCYFNLKDNDECLRYSDLKNIKKAFNWSERKLLIEKI